MIRENGAFLTSRVIPKMASVCCVVDDGRLTLQCPGMDDISVPLQPEKSSKIINTRCVKILSLCTVLFTQSNTSCLLRAQAF